MNGFDENDAFEGAVQPSLSSRAMAARPAPYMNGLNPPQRDAVEALDGPVLMLAGAGTGKTRALTARIAHLLTSGTAKAGEILAVTFTNKAAREMKNRVATLMGHEVAGMPWLGTFHSVSVRILRRHAELIARPMPGVGRADDVIDDEHMVNLKSNFTILDTDDQLRLLKQVILAAGMDEKRWPARQLAGLIDGWKNRALTPEQVPAADAGAFNNRGTELYAAYQDRLLALNAVDFGDLLLHVVTLFRTHPDVLAPYQSRLRYILVDEYQDTNVAQYLWLRLLAQAHHNICCVGDDDQSIYGWRGAEIGNILRFEKDFPGAKVIRLEQNYRSTGHILAAASSVIAQNSGRLGKTLWTDAEDGAKVRLIGHWDGEEEARWIGDEIEALRDGRRGIGAVRLNDQAILVRASHQMRAFEDRFLTIGLPYRVIGGPRFYERQEIRDAMAYFRLAVSTDDDLAFERIVNTPRRGLGDKAQQTVQQMARADGTSLFEGARHAVEGSIGGKGGAALRTLVEQIDRWHATVLEASPVTATSPPDDDDALFELQVTSVRPANDHSHMRLAEQILEDSGYIAMWQNDKTPEAAGRLENLKELIKALEQFENLQGFLEHVALILDNESAESDDKVTLMTLHAAKGLEFPAVFLPGWEDGLFPSQRAMDESGQKGLEEERRLAYVGITRAERLSTISFAGNRRVYGQWQSQMPSRFIDELPEASVEILIPPGLYGGGYGAAAQYGGASEVETRAAHADVYNSPGWKRMNERARERPVASVREVRRTTIDLTAVPAFALGARVFHKKFGYGTVEGMEGDKVEVAFEKAGVKKIVAGFVVAAEDADDVPF